MNLQEPFLNEKPAETGKPISFSVLLLFALLDKSATGDTASATDDFLHLFHQIANARVD